MQNSIAKIESQSEAKDTNRLFFSYFKQRSQQL